MYTSLENFTEVHTAFNEGDTTPPRVGGVIWRGGYANGALAYDTEHDAKRLRDSIADGLHLAPDYAIVSRVFLLLREPAMQNGHPI